MKTLGYDIEITDEGNFLNLIKPKEDMYMMFSEELIVNKVDQKHNMIGDQSSSGDEDIPEDLYGKEDN